MSLICLIRMTYSYSKKQRGLPHSDLKSVKPFCLEEMRYDTMLYDTIRTSLEKVASRDCALHSRTLPDRNVSAHVSWVK